MKAFDCIRLFSVAAMAELVLSKIVMNKFPITARYLSTTTLSSTHDLIVHTYRGMHSRKMNGMVDM